MGGGRPNPPCPPRARAFSGWVASSAPSPSPSATALRPLPPMISLSMSTRCRTIRRFAITISAFSASDATIGEWVVKFSRSPAREARTVVGSLVEPPKTSRWSKSAMAWGQLPSPKNGFCGIGGPSFVSTMLGAPSSVNVAMSDWPRKPKPPTSS